MHVLGTNKTSSHHDTRSYLSTDKLKIYFDLCIINYFLDIISPRNDMLAKLQQLLDDYPETDTTAMVFPLGWKQEPL